MKREPGVLTLLKVCFRLLILPATLPAGATTYYIATNGNDSWTGTASNFVRGTTGPWADFGQINWGQCVLQPGDIVYVCGVWNGNSGSLSGAIFLAGLNGTSNSPIVLSNLSGCYTCISNSISSRSTISLQSCSWIRIFGINSTNAYRGPILQYCTNCEIAYCDFGGGPAATLGTPGFAIGNFSCSNWIHNVTVHDSIVGTETSDTTHGLTVGLFFDQAGPGQNLPDYSCYNIIESNICYHHGHDALSLYGPSNLAQFNYVHNEAFITNLNWSLAGASTNGLWSAHRCMEVGGTIGNYNVVQNNRLGYAGEEFNFGSHSIEMSDPAFTIVRNNVLFCDTYCGLTVYGGKAATWCGSNYIYNNTIYGNGFGSQTLWQWGTNSSGWYVPVKTNTYPNYSVATLFTCTSNNMFLNNLLWGNFNNGFVQMNSGVFQIFANNFTDVDPLFVNANDAGPWQTNLPNFALQANSPCLNAGAWCTTITSASGSGTSFTVADPNWFSTGMTACTRYIAPDSIELQGQSTVAQITSISGNTITVNTPLTWATGQGVALPYGGSAPNVGAYQSTRLPPPSNLRIVPSP